MLRFALTLFLGSFVALPVVEVAAVITVFNPSQDTFIDEGDSSPFSANGSSAILEVGRFSIFSPSTDDSVATVSSTANPVFSITTLVQSWVDGSTANHGVYIDNEFNSNASGNFHSSNSLTGSIPALTVDFTAIPESASGVGVGLLALVLVVRRRVV